MIDINKKELEKIQQQIKLIIIKEKLKLLELSVENFDTLFKNELYFAQKYIHLFPNDFFSLKCLLEHNNIKCHV